MISIRLQNSAWILKWWYLAGMISLWSPYQHERSSNIRLLVKVLCLFQTLDKLKNNYTGDYCKSSVKIVWCGKISTYFLNFFHISIFRVCHEFIFCCIWQMKMFLLTCVQSDFHSSVLKCPIYKTIPWIPSPFSPRLRRYHPSTTAFVTTSPWRLTTPGLPLHVRLWCHKHELLMLGYNGTTVLTVGFPLVDPRGSHGGPGPPSPGFWGPSVQFKS